MDGLLYIPLYIYFKVLKYRSFKHFARKYLKSKQPKKSRMNEKKRSEKSIMNHLRKWEK